MKYTKEQLIFYLRKLSKKLKRSPTIKDINSEKKYPSSSTYTNRFGSWNKSLEIANLAPNRNKYSKKEMIQALKQLHKELGRIPKVEDLSKKWIASGSTYREKFGSWKEALKKAGLVRKDLKNYLKSSKHN